MKRYLLHTISFLPLFAQLTRVIVPTTVVGDLREAHDERGCPHGSPVDERTPRIPTALSAQKKLAICVSYTHVCAWIQGILLARRITHHPAGSRSAVNIG